MATAIPQTSLNVSTGTPDPIAEFKEVLDACTRQSVIHQPPRDFILANRLLKWFQSEPTYDPGTQNVYNLLEDVLGADDNPNLINAMVQDLKTVDGCWLKVFTILLLLDKPKYIVTFWRGSIQDRRLPNISERELNTFLSEMSECDLREEELKQFTTDFVALQYLLCTQTPLDSRNGGKVGPAAILPICKLDPIKIERPNQVKADDSSKIYQIEVPRECIPNSIVHDIGKPYKKGVEEYHEFALKILRHHEDYKQETRAYLAMKDRKGIVQCLGFWEFQRPLREPEYHLLLEYGQFDLDEYFETFPPQSLPCDIIQFWKDLSSVVVALETIHNLKIKVHGRHGATETWYGWHGDLKPENIIYCKNGWKIADPGYAQFIRGQDKMQVDENGFPVTILRGGTSTYGPPEGAFVPKRPVTQRFDIWSLGCVFSEAATWLLLGQRGVEQYRFVRKTVQDIHQSTISNDLRGDDCFHNQGGISGAVVEWHKYLKNSLRTGDSVTGAILNLVEGGMLITSVKKRISAKTLVRSLNDIITKAEKDESLNKYEPPNYFAKAFRAEQRKASEEWSNPASQLTVRKSNRYKSTRYAPGNLPLGSDILPYSQPAPFESNLLSNSEASQPKANVSGPDRAYTESSNAFGLGVFDARSHFSRSPYGEPEDTDRFDYWDALNLLEKQGWMREGTLERPQDPREAPVPTMSNAFLSPPVNHTGGSTDSKTTVPQPRPSSFHTKSKGSRSSISQFSQLFKRTPRSTSSSISSKQRPVVPHAENKPTTNKTPSSNLEMDIKYKNNDFDSFFDKRDIVFLLDNGVTMADHWPRARELMAVLVALLHGQDDNGMEMYFTSSRTKHGPFTEPRQFVESINQMRPLNNQRSSQELDHRDEANADDIREVLFEVILSLVGRAGYKRKLTLIILTDGIWKRINSKRTVANGIINYIERWEDREGLKKLMGKRELSIQFIQFGSDEDASFELEYMDNRLSKADGSRLPDIIDVEPESGNVKKMILGSLSDEWDGDAPTVASDDSQSRAGQADRLGSLPGNIGNSPTQPYHIHFANQGGEAADYEQADTAVSVSSYNPGMDIKDLGTQFGQPRTHLQSTQTPRQVTRQEFSSPRQHLTKDSR